MEPLSIVSSVVGVISLAEYALQLGTGLCQIVAKVRAASDQLNNLHTELKQLTDIINNLKKLMEWMKECQEFIPVNSLDGDIIIISIGDVLCSFIKEVEDFENSITANESRQWMCLVWRIAKKLRLVQNEPKINAILSRIATRKSTLSLNISMLLAWCNIINLRTIREHRLLNHRSIPRSLSTFAKHPNDSPIFNYLKSGNFEMVRQLMVSHKISANDRDEHGNSLLWYAIYSNYNYKICDFLLESGADPHNCNCSSDHALAILVGNLPRNAQDVGKLDGTALSLIRSFMRKCQAEEVYGTYEYKTSRATKYAHAALLHCVLSRRNANIPIYEIVKLILDNGFDTEEQDINENTALLNAVYYSSQSEVTEITRSMLMKGANIHVRNIHKEGCLHLLLRRLSACNNREMSKTRADAFIDLLASLLQQGCDPTQENREGYTPFDAALSPTVWPIFCAALKKVDMDIRTHIRRIDRSNGIVQTDFIMVERSLSAIDIISTASRAHKTRQPKPENAVERPCYLCGRETVFEEDRTIPFDEFTSVIVDEIGVGIHMKLCKAVNGMHVNGDNCLWVHREGSCHLLDYYPGRMSSERKKARSWRMHVALDLWHEGCLWNPPT